MAKIRCNKYVAPCLSARGDFEDAAARIKMAVAPKG